MSINAWPEWIRDTLAALAGAVIMLVSLTLAWGDVRHDAAYAKIGVDLNGVRIGVLERRISGDDEWRRGFDVWRIALDIRLSRIEDKLGAR